MGQHPMETFAHELRAALESGALAHRGRVQLSDGVTVDSERMARIILADFERITQGEPEGWLTEQEEYELYDDLRRLLTLAQGAVRT